MNLIDLPLSADGALLGGYTIPLSREIFAAAAADGATTATIGVRPEDLHVAEQGFDLDLTLVEMLGSDSFIYGDVTDASGKPHQITIRVDAQQTPQRGERIRLAPRAGSAFAFSSETGARYYG
jgi:multiple sugar transport system ATP-binding protein